MTAVSWRQTAPFSSECASGGPDRLIDIGLVAFGHLRPDFLSRRINGLQSPARMSFTPFVPYEQGGVRKRRDTRARGAHPGEPLGRKVILGELEHGHAHFHRLRYVSARYRFRPLAVMVCNGIDQCLMLANSLYGATWHRQSGARETTHSVVDLPHELHEQSIPRGPAKKFVELEIQARHPARVPSTIRLDDLVVDLPESCDINGGGPVCGQA